jgi:hypothetical protein
MRRVLVAVVLAVALCAAGTAPAGAAGSAARPKLATEVCESMVRDAVVSVARRSLVAPQAGSWDGPRFTCRYVFGFGSAVVLQVDVRRDTASAKAAFSSARRAAIEPEKFAGIGQQSFQSKDGVLVARKDRFVLRIDPTSLPRKLHGRDVAFAAAMAVLSCWTG